MDDKTETRPMGQEIQIDEAPIRDQWTPVREPAARQQLLRLTEINAEGCFF